MQRRDNSKIERKVPFTKPAALAPGGAAQSNACYPAFGFGGRPERPSGGHQEWSQSQHRGLLHVSDQRRCWAPWPLRPVVGQQIICEFVYGLAAVSPFEGELCSLVLPGVDTETMSLFLAHTAACFPNDHCLRLDGAGWHTAAALQVPPTLHLQPLPPFSPELNPLEHVWDRPRENYMGNQVFSSLDAFVEQLFAGLHYLHRDHEVVRSMTCFDWIKTYRRG